MKIQPIANCIGFKLNRVDYIKATYCTADIFEDTM